MTDVQKTSLELLKVFSDICSRLDIRFYLVCGSALGAVKYGGFIPWDDDIDVALLREDYERFLKEAPEYLPEHMALQNIHTNKAFPLLMTKLVNVNTTLIEGPYLQLPIHHSIFMDIFPLDGYPAGKLEAQVFEIKKWIYNKLRCAAYRFNYRLLGLNRIMLRYEAMLKAQPCEGSPLLCNYANWQGKLDYSPRDEYGGGVQSCFEGMQLLIPSGYDSYFSRKYGDWKQELPQEQRQSHHVMLKCDTRRSYKDYIYKEKGKFKVRDVES